MATITGNEIIVPEIYAQMATEKLEGTIKLTQLATVIRTLEGSQEGDSITFPSFCALSEAELVTKGVEISTEELNQKSTKKEVKHIAPKAALIYDQDDKTAMGSFVENAQMQHGKTIARGMDKELAKDILENAILKSPTAQGSALTEEELIAGFQLFGDEQDNEDMAGILINSRLAPSFYAMNGFVKNDISYVNPLNGIIMNGVIGYYRGSIPIIMSDVNTYDNTANECITYIVKKDSLGIIPKTGMRVSKTYLDTLFCTRVVTDKFFACGLIQKDGVVILRKTIV